MINDKLQRGNIVQLLTPPDPIKLPSGIYKKVVSVGPFNVGLVDLDKPEVQQEPKEVPYDDITAAPITKEILLQAGFYECDKDAYAIDLPNYHDTSIHYHNDTKELILFLDDSAGQAIDIKHMHQLQNLYYTLTKQELELNL